MEVKNNSRRDDIIFIAALVALSIVLYIVHFLIFKDLHHISVFALEDLAFVPIEVLFVSLILHRVMNANENKKKIGKLYMVIEVFFNNIGFEILHIMATKDLNIDQVQDEFVIEDNWSKKTVIKKIKAYTPNLDLNAEDFSQLYGILEQEKNDMLRMIENPMLLEHETFSELLMAVFHMYKEFSMRVNFNALTETDRKHLISDVERAYVLLSIEWIEYLQHMKTHYPYLYNFSMRVNPYEEETHAEID